MKITSAATNEENVDLIVLIQALINQYGDGTYLVVNKIPEAAQQLIEGMDKGTSVSLKSYSPDGLAVILTLEIK